MGRGSNLVLLHHYFSYPDTSFFFFCNFWVQVTKQRLINFTTDKKNKCFRIKKYQISQKITWKLYATLSKISIKCTGLISPSLATSGTTIEPVNQYFVIWGIPRYQSPISFEAMLLFWCFQKENLRSWRNTSSFLMNTKSDVSLPKQTVIFYTGSSLIFTI